MKNKINAFQKEISYSTAGDIFPETRIIMRVGEGEMYKEAFSLRESGRRGQSVDWFIHRLFGYAVRSRDLMGIR